MGKKKKTSFQWERDAPEVVEVERPSRSQLKREEESRKELVMQLLALSESELARLPISDALRGSLATAVRLQDSRTARAGYRRQLRHAAGLLRLSDVEAIAAAMPKTQPG